MIEANTHVRIARPSRDLAAAERFYVDGLGLTVLYKETDPAEGEHELLMAGLPGAGWHFELTRGPSGTVVPSPTADDLFVLYLGRPVEDALIDRLTEHGGERVAAHNPYWDQWGVTVRDPDGYLLVLSSRSWG
ncbi:VOC family protein [Phytomonospora sp. NPDC050363]|uniref:VOC family protein n=1 Tax=Phytomonospora sp. NPDC050363 TaxID=3155642 RepID=UPI00340E4789